jgi:hypothetical protein
MKCRLQGAAAGCTHGRYIRWHLGRTALQRPETRAAGWETFLTRQIVYKVERFTVDVAAAWAPAGLQTAREASKRILASTDALRVEHKLFNLNLSQGGGGGGAEGGGAGRAEEAAGDGGARCGRGGGREREAITFSSIAGRRGGDSGPCGGGEEARGTAAMHGCPARALGIL